MQRATVKKFALVLSFSLTAVIQPTIVSAASSDVNTRQFTRWDYYSYKYVGNNLQRKVLPSENMTNCNPCSWTKKDIRTAKAFDPIRAQAFAEIKRFGKNKKPELSEINWLFSKNVQPSLVKMYKKLNTDSLNYWHAEIRDPIPYRMIVGTEKDRDEVKANLAETEGGLESLEGMNRFFDRYANLKDYEKVRPVGGGSPRRDKLITSNQDVYLVTYHVGSFTTDQKVFVTTPAHEITHVLQTNRSNNVGYNNKMPVSLWEGSAVLFGSGIPMPNIAWYSDELDHQLQRFFSNYATKVKMNNESDAVNLLLKAEKTNSDMSVEAGYYIGAILFEYLIAKYGVQKFLDLVDATGTETSFDNALLKAYGQNRSEIYKKSAPYVLKTYQRVLKVFNS